jgi:hypothetical protein
MYLQRALLHSLMEFADKFGANLLDIEEGLRDAEDLKKGTDVLYLDEDYTGALRGMGEAIGQLVDLQGAAVKLKERALVWIYVVEWLAVLSTLMVSGFVLWTLMVRRAVYREVKATGRRY